MWQLEWGTSNSETHRHSPTSFESQVDASRIKNVYGIVWAEHCVECALPDCYHVCPLYVAREDKKCARFQYGIHANKAFEGLFPFGADIAFRRWGKLEGYGGNVLLSPGRARFVAALDRCVATMVKFVSRMLRPVSPTMKLNGAYTIWREKIYRAVARVATPVGLDAFHEFLIEAWNPSKRMQRLVLEAHEGALRYRGSFDLHPGVNVLRIPYRDLNINIGRPGVRLLVSPDNDEECRIVFTWLDFVAYDRAPPDRVDAPKAPAPKVKCVVWDLDNTVWEGILLDDGSDGVRLRDDAVRTIRTLDSRGILQSVASKNDYAPAWQKLEECGLAEYFLHPQIGWWPKSTGIKNIVSALNIGVDTIAFVDDSAVELNEVRAAHPQVRVYPESSAGALVALPEFDVPVTEESKIRRQSYREEESRTSAAAEYEQDHYDIFLAGCGLRATIFHPTSESDIERCLELLHRSNQLNLTTYRYPRAEFLALLKDPSVVSAGVRCSDRFGTYGTVVFLSIDLKGSQPVLRDFVISCRVARKRVENACLAWVQQSLSELGFRQLDARFKPTSRNDLLREVLKEIGFEGLANQTGEQAIQLPFAHIVPHAKICHVDLGTPSPFASLHPVRRAQ